MLWLNVCIVLYALIMFMGGLMGYKMAGSTESLATGIVSAVLLLGSVFAAKTNPRIAYGVATVVVLGLAVVFLERCRATDWNPRNIGLFVGSLVMVALLVVGHFVDRRPI